MEPTFPKTDGATTGDGDHVEDRDESPLRTLCKCLVILMGSAMEARPEDLRASSHLDRVASDVHQWVVTRIDTRDDADVHRL